MCIKIIGLNFKCCWILKVSGLHSNLRRYYVNEKIYKMRTVLLNTIICCFHGIRLAFFQTLMIFLHGNASPHPKKLA